MSMKLINYVNKNYNQEIYYNRTRNRKNLSAWESIRQGSFWSGKCPSGKCPSGKYLSGKCLVGEMSVGEVSGRGNIRWGSVRWGCVRWGCVRRGTVRTPFSSYLSIESQNILQNSSFGIFLENSTKLFQQLQPIPNTM